MKIIDDAREQLADVSEMSLDEIYNYHGWEKIKDTMVYLSNSRDDCDCNVNVPKNQA